MREHSLKFFNLALLSIKIIFAHIMLESIFFYHFHSGEYINVGENKLFS